MTRELRKLLVVAGPVVWVMIGLPVLLRRPPLDARFAVWAGCYAAFGAAFWLGLRRPAWVLVQAAAVVGVVLSMCHGFEGALLVLVALRIGGLFGRVRGLVAISLQSAALFAAIAVHWNPQAALLLTPPYLAFQVLAFFAAEGLVRLEAAEDLRLRNERLEERLRISRELHDRLGHHLTALNLNLEAAASNQDALVAARGLGRTLLAQVRETVADLREPERGTENDGGGIDVCGALRTLAEELPQPRVHLSAPASLPLHDANGALVVLRCAQEIATNAARHAQAQNLWLELSQQGATLELRARDDGRGATELRPGNGLRGMRERLESAGGSLSVHTAPGEGFSLHARLPLRSDA
jgi:signal transduction histidine kinase